MESADSHRASDGSIWAIAFGVAVAVLPVLPVALSAQRQSWYFDYDVQTYALTALSHFGLCLAIAGAIAAVIRMFTEPMAIKLALLSSVVAGALAAMAYNISDRIAADMRPEAGEWRVMASMLDGLRVLAHDAKVVRAPRLAAGSVFTHTGLPDDRYWSDYLAARYGRALEVKTDFVREADLERGVVSLDFGLMGDGHSHLPSRSRAIAVLSPGTYSLVGSMRLLCMSNEQLTPY